MRLEFGVWRRWIRIPSSVIFLDMLGGIFFYKNRRVPEVYCSSVQWKCRCSQDPHDQTYSSRNLFTRPNPLILNRGKIGIILHIKYGSHQFLAVVLPDATWNSNSTDTINNEILNSHCRLECLISVCPRYVAAEGECRDSIVRGMIPSSCLSCLF